MRRALTSLTVAAVTLLGAGAALAAAPTAPTTAPATAATTVDATHRDTFTTTTTAGEGVLDLTVSAPGADWSSPVSYDATTMTRTGHAGGMLEVDVDGTKATDLDVFTATPTARQVEVGALTAGTHTVTIGLGTASLLGSVDVSSPALSISTDPALAYAPLLYGRNLSAYDNGDPDQNAYDDAPVTAWHETTTPAPGQVEYQFSVIWTNEDNGTGSPDLMGRWGRTTDIELEYSVVLNTATGLKVPTMETFQGPNHATTQFKGSYVEGTHPVLQTCTGNNNFCDSATANEDGNAGISDPLQYFMSYADTRVPTRARESLMDAHPWIYPVMAAEQLREGKLKASDCAPAGTTQADTKTICDQRDYVFMELVKSTATPAPPYDPTGEAGNLQTIGVSLLVTLTDGTTYTSDRGVTGRTAVRDVPINESVDLPHGITPAQVATVSAVRMNSEPQYPDSMSAVTVSSFNSMFFLGPDYLPQQGFLGDGTSLKGGSVVLTTAAPSAVIWQRTATGTTDPPAALPEVGAPVALVLLGIAGGLVVARRTRLRR